MEQTPREGRQALIDASCEQLSLRRQCELLSINHSTLYYEAKPAVVDDCHLLNDIREIWERCPFYGYRCVTRDLKQGFVYLVALIDVYSRYVVSWRIATTMETSFCVEALKSGLLRAKPEIVNSDQGSQFTSTDWVDCVTKQGIQISMTGKGRCLDNVYIERFWRSFKREEFYLNEYASIVTLKQATAAYIEFYNYRRWHQSLDYQTPSMVYFKQEEANPMDMWTSPAEQPAPFGACEPVMNNAHALPTT